MLKKLLLVGLLALLALPGYADQSITLAYGWEMDGEGADVDQVVTAAEIEDSKNDYTIAAQPDTCRLIDVTFVDGDASISAGVVTITGTDCLGNVKSVDYDLADGAGVVSADSDETSGYFKTITQVATGVVTGEGGAADTIAVGYSTGTPTQRAVYGVYRGDRDGAGLKYIDVGASRRYRKRVTTSGVYTTALVEVTTGDDPFDYCLVNDMLIFNIDGVRYERKIVTWTNDSAVTLNKGINIPAAGVEFECMNFFVTSDPTDITEIDLGGATSVAFGWSVDANTDTGGVVTTLRCRYDQGPEYPTGIWITLDQTTTASAATQTPTFDAIDLLKNPFEACEVTWAFGTADDDDTGAEDLNLEVTIRREQ